MKRLQSFAIVVLVCLLASGAAAGNKKRVAVLDFDFSAVQRWWDSNWDVGQGISDIIVRELVQDGTYSVIERRAMDALLAEQNFSTGERANPATAARIGQLLGVDAIIVGTITQFGTEDSRTNIGGIGGRLGGFGGARVGTSRGKAHVAVESRVVDVNTGEILAVASGKGESARSGLLLGGLGVGGGRFGAGQIDMGSSDFRETILGEATYEAVESLSKELVDADRRLPVRERKVKGLVAYVQPGLVILNVGSAHGVQVGDEFRILRVKDTIQDPATGRVLRELTEEVGRVRITSTENDSSEGAVASGGGISVGDIVQNY